MITKVNRLVDDSEQPDLVAIRLESLGFVPGTQVQVITKGVFGGDPILIQIGFTRFALRKTEAEKIEIQVEGAPAWVMRYVLPLCEIQTAVKPLYLTTSLEHAKKLPTMRV